MSDLNKLDALLHNEHSGRGRGFWGEKKTYKGGGRVDKIGGGGGLHKFINFIGNMFKLAELFFYGSKDWAVRVLSIYSFCRSVSYSNSSLVV